MKFLHIGAWFLTSHGHIRYREVVTCVPADGDPTSSVLGQVLGCAKVSPT